MNLPNALSLGRIIVAPLIALLPFAPAWPLRLAGFVLYIAAAITDYYDGVLARTRGLITDLGKLLDPLADKLLLLATLVPMYILMQGRGVPAEPFRTPAGAVGLPLWVLLVVLGRELFMTIFRQYAARHGLIIAAIGPAKWKMGFQSVWVGAAYFWFAARRAAEQLGWGDTLPWRWFAWFNGIVGVTTMIVAVALTIWSLWLYLRRYGGAVARGVG